MKGAVINISIPKSIFQLSFHDVWIGMFVFESYVIVYFPARQKLWYLGCTCSVDKHMVLFFIRTRFKNYYNTVKKENRLNLTDMISVLMVTWSVGLWNKIQEKYIPLPFPFKTTVKLVSYCHSSQIMPNEMAATFLKQRDNDGPFI